MQFTKAEAAYKTTLIKRWPKIAINFNPQNYALPKKALVSNTTYQSFTVHQW